MAARAKKTKPAPRLPMGRPKLLQNPVRKLISLERHQWKKLETIATQEGVSVPQVLRDMIDRRKV